MLNYSDVKGLWSMAHEAGARLVSALSQGAAKVAKVPAGASNSGVERMCSVPRTSFSVPVSCSGLGEISDLEIKWYLTG